MEISMINCKGCTKIFPINGIRRHISQTSCKKQYTSEEFAHLVKLCESHKRQKKLEKKAENYQKRKSQKNVKVWNTFWKSIIDFYSSYNNIIKISRMTSLSLLMTMSN